MPDDTGHPVPSPSELCGYPVDSALTSSGSAYLAIGPGGRGIVLKRMDDDCLLRGQLHPSIRERLSRVRELAHGGVANLYGVGRDGGEGGEGAAGSAVKSTAATPGAGQVWLIWEYVEGQSFSDYAAMPKRSLRELAAVGRELALALDLLHMQGIVHGAIGGGNVIVSETGSVRITHVSPLLYTDPVPDGEAVIHLLESGVLARGEAGSPLGAVLAQARVDRLPLRSLAAKLATLIESRELDEYAEARRRDDRPRRTARRAALAITVIGALAGVVAWQAARSPGLRARVGQWLGE